MINEKTKEEIAKDINYVADVAVRTIMGNIDNLGLEEDSVFETKKAESWGIEQSEFEPAEFFEGRKIVFYCEDLPCHKVDYKNAEECEALGATDCEDECEVLVPAGTKFLVERIATDEDYREMGYYEITLSLAS